MSTFPFLPADTRPGPVHLQVSDLGRSLAWYQRILGPTVLEQEPGRVLLGAAEGTPLVELREHPGTRPVSPRSRLGLFHFALLLPDRPSLGRFLAHLAAMGEPMGAGDHHVSEALYLHDPDGLGVEVCADRPRETWTRRPDGELLMGTDPVDLPSLVRAGGEAPWEGLPASTVMGHLHLHVGDLDAAQAFYARALGLEVTVRSYPGALFLSAGGYHHHLGVNTWARGAPSPGPDDARLLGWELHLPHREGWEAAGARLAAAGHRVERSSPDVLEVTDPWGTVLRLVRV
jgi:catechol 2,3-dioxygenase